MSELYARPCVFILICSWTFLVLKEDFTSCTDGATCTFVMKDSNIKAPVKLSVVPEESLIFSGSMLGGLAKFTGDIKLTSVGVESTKINYSFEMKGFVGMLLNTFKSKEIVGGTEKGLENIVKLSEEAQKK